jgi:hypothetical protein
MYKVLSGLALAAIVVQPALAQDYHRNFVECAKELGLNPSATSGYKLQSGATLRSWQLHSEAQQAVFNDCVARKASLATPPSKLSGTSSAKGTRRVSR